MRSRRNAIKLVVAISAVAISLIVPISRVIATSLPAGVGFQEGYFSGVSTPGSGFGAVISSCDGNDPIDPTMVDKATFINKVMSFYGGCGSSSYNQTRNSIGGKFIIQTMRQNRSSNVSASDIENWKDRINNPSITIRWVYDSSFSFNSGYTGSMGIGVNDDAYYDAGGTHDALVFYDADGNVVYQLKSNCANPIGGIGLPPPPSLTLPSWHISTTSTADRPTATPGETITWTHVVKNDGPDPTDTNVTYHYQNHNGLGEGQGTDGNFQSGENKDTTRVFTSTYLVQPSDVYKNLCRATSASPKAKTNGVLDSGWVESTPACVSISSTPVSNVCRPMVVAVASPGTDYFGVVPINVSTRDNSDGSVQFIGTNPPSSSIDITSTHTTGDQYTVTAIDSRQWATHNFHVIGGAGPPPWSFSWWTIDFSGPYQRGSSIVGPCYDYKLTANIGNSFSNRVESDSIVNINPSVSSASYTGIYHTKSKPSKWQITKMVVPPNVSVPPFVANSNSSLDPCRYFDPSGVSQCTVQATNSTTVFSVTGTPSMSMSSSYIVPDIPAGTKICFAFSIYPSQSDPNNNSSSWGLNDQWNHATFDPANNCVIIVKKPKVQIWGGDLWSGGSVDASTSTKNMGGIGRTFGSWAEYGIFATGTVSGMASGSAFYGLGLANANISGCNYSILTFTNADSSTCGIGTVKGNYQNAKTIPDIAASFPSAGTTIIANSIVPNDLLATSGTYVGTHNGDLTLTQSNLSPGKSIILKVSGTVTITGNQTYNPDNNGSKYNNVSQLPQLVIIANRIVINSNVTNVDAWLVAKNNSNNGSIYTCDVEGKTINDCKNPLTVNGPITTDKIYLRRTAGSGIDAASGDPAEVLNLRADAYLWAYAQAKSSSRVQTVYTTELPPRF